MPSPTPLNSERPVRGWVAAACLAGAVATHILALAGIAGVMGAWERPGRSAAPETVRIVEVAAPRRVDGPSPPGVAGTGPTAPVAAAAVPAAPATRRQSRPRIGAAAAASAPAAAHFYRLSEVDRPASPADDWNLDVAALDALGLERLVVELYVNAEGRIVECRVLEPATLAPEVREMLAQRLAATAMLAAARGERPVPSVRVIEFSTLPALEPMLPGR